MLGRRATHRTHSRLLTVAMALLLSAACTPAAPGPSASPGASRPGPTDGATATSCGSSDARKAPLAALVVQGSGSAVAGSSISVNVAWASLQPTAGAPLVHPNPIDAAISQLASTGQPCAGIRLRVLAGTSAPEWAKQLGGPPIDVTLGYDQRQGTVGRFWTAQFGDAYAELQRLLAQDYDDNPLIREVAVSRCTTFYAEPMVRQADEPATVAALIDAGYTVAADLRCQHEELVESEPWRRTNIYLALNPYENIAGSHGARRSVDDTIGIAKDCRALLHDRCVLGNNSVRTPMLGGAYPALYARMRELGPPLSFQLAAPSRVGDVVAAVDWCISVGARSVELSDGSASALLSSSATHGSGQLRRWLGG